MRESATEPPRPAEATGEPADAPKRKAPRTAFKPGNNANPYGRAGKPEEPDPEGGVVTAARMRKVLGQSKPDDSGAVERWLRSWLQRNPATYLEAIEKRARAEGEDATAREENVALKAEVAALRGRVAELEERGADVPEADPGSDTAMALVEKIEAVLTEAGADVGPDGRCRGCGQRVPAAGVPAGDGPR